jgi:hypothetical protein
MLGMNHVTQLSKKGINTLGKVSSQIGINITSKELEDDEEEEDDDDDKTSATTKQSSTSSTLPLSLPPLSSSTTSNNLFNEQQCDLIRHDLQIIFDAYIKYNNDEKIMEVLRFFNSTILSIIDNNNNNNKNNNNNNNNSGGQFIDSKKIEHILKTRFLIAVSYVIFFNKY